MNEGYKNWPTVRKMLIDNRLEHAALLAYSIRVPESLFVRRAMAAYRKIESRVDDAVEIANDMLNTVANAVAAEEERAARAEKPEASEECKPVEENPPADVVPPKVDEP